MIIFDLDGTLADCEHRRHFVDRNHPKNQNKIFASISLDSTPEPSFMPLWKPDWQSFYEACGKDEPIKYVIEILFNCLLSGRKVQIWSGRCESVRENTIKWLERNLNSNYRRNSILFEDPKLKVKMRPVGDNTPDDHLKERWLDEAIAEGKKIDFVFDDRPKVIRMWRRRGIFVFNCCQHEGEF
jgi:hypothetical protein